MVAAIVLLLPTMMLAELKPPRLAAHVPWTTCEMAGNCKCLGVDLEPLSGARRTLWLTGEEGHALHYLLSVCQPINRSLLQSHCSNWKTMGDVSFVQAGNASSPSPSSASWGEEGEKSECTAIGDSHTMSAMLANTTGGIPALRVRFTHSNQHVVVQLTKGNQPNPSKVRDTPDEFQIDWKTLPTDPLPCISWTLNSWSFQTSSDAIKSSPAVGTDGTVYVGGMCGFGPGSEAKRSDSNSSGASCEGGLYALTSAGGLKWRFSAGSVQSSPTVGPDGTIYVGSDDGNLYAVTPAGDLKWKFSTRGPVTSSPTLDKDGNVFVGSADFCLYAVTARGKLKWSFGTGAAITFSSPALDPKDGTVFIGSDDYNVYAVNASGKLKWKFETGVMSGTPIRYVRSSPLLHGDTVFVGSLAPYVYGLDKTSGRKVQGYRTIHGTLSSPAAGVDPQFNNIYIGEGLIGGDPRDFFLAGLQAEPQYFVFGQWRFYTGAAITSSPRVGPGTEGQPNDEGYYPSETVYFGTADGHGLGYLYAVTGITRGETSGWCRNPAGGLGGSCPLILQWKFRTQAAIDMSSPALGANGTVYIGDMWGHVYGVKPVRHVTVCTAVTPGPIPAPAPPPPPPKSDYVQTCRMAGGRTYQCPVEEPVCCSLQHQIHNYTNPGGSWIADMAHCCTMDAPVCCQGEVCSTTQPNSCEYCGGGMRRTTRLNATSSISGVPATTTAAVARVANAWSSNVSSGPRPLSRPGWAKDASWPPPTVDCTHEDTNCFPDYPVCCGQTCCPHDKPVCCGNSRCCPPETSCGPNHTCTACDNAPPPCASIKTHQHCTAPRCEWKAGKCGNPPTCWKANGTCHARGSCTDEGECQCEPHYYPSSTSTTSLEQSLAQ